MAKKRNRNNVAFVISLAIHFVLILVLSPFLLKQFNEKEDDLSLVIFPMGTVEQVKRLMMRQNKSLQPIRNLDSGSTAPSLAAPKYSPEMDPPKALYYDEYAPEIVTVVDIPKTKSFTLPNKSFGTEEASSGPVVIPEFRGAGGRVIGPGRGKGTGRSGTGAGGGSSGLVNRLSRIDGLDDLASIKLDDDIMGLGIFETDVNPGHGLLGQVYIPNEPIFMMPNFKRLDPVYTFATAYLNVSPRDYTAGFPTPQKQKVLEDFAIRFFGKLAVVTPGTYIFELYSDDGAKLFINGHLVVDNDGVHQPRRKRNHIRLTAGLHAVEIQYFQGPRFQIALQWYYKPPNQKLQIVPPEVIFSPGKHDLPVVMRKVKQNLRLKDILNK